MYVPCSSKTDFVAKEGSDEEMNSSESDESSDSGNGSDSTDSDSD